MRRVRNHMVRPSLAAVAAAAVAAPLPLVAGQGPFSYYGPYTPWSCDGPLVLGPASGVHNAWTGGEGEGFKLGAAPGSSDAASKLNPEGVGGGVPFDNALSNGLVTAKAEIESAVTAMKSFEKAAEVFVKAAMTPNCYTPEQQDVRMEGLCGLKNLATNPSIRGAVWEDIPARTALIAGAKIMQDSTLNKQAVVCAVEAIGLLALNNTVAREMWLCGELTEVIFARTTMSNIGSVRAAAYVALRNMADDPTVAHKMWKDEDGARRIIFAGADSSLPHVKTAAFEIMQRWGRCKLLRRELFQDPKIDELLQSAIRFEQEQLQIARAAALGLLANLALDHSNAKEIWGDELLWRIWIQIAATPLPTSSTPSDILTPLNDLISNLPTADKASANNLLALPAASLGHVPANGAQALSSLSDVKGIREELWKNLLSRNLLIYWAQVAPSSEEMLATKLWALYALGNLAKCDDLRMEIWTTIGQSIFVTIAADTTQSAEARFLAYIGLWELAGAWQTKSLIWDEPTARSLLEQGVAFTDCGRIRDVALGVAYRLSTNDTVSQDMWEASNELFRERIIQAAEELEGMDNLLGRQFAIAIVYQWARLCVDRADQMWADTDLRQVVLDLVALEDEYASMIRAFAMATIGSWAKFATLRPLIWNDVTARATVLREAVDFQSSAKTVRATALCTLQEIAMDETLLDDMWADEELRDALVKAVMDLSSPQAQECALMTISNLAVDTSVSLDMWRTNSTRLAVMVQAANCLTPARKLALMALRSMAENNPEIRQCMWYGGAGYLFVKMASPTACPHSPAAVSAVTEAWALAGLASLALDPEVARKMWNDRFTAIAVIKKQAMNTDSIRLSARIYALATLWHLAIDRGNAAPMWFDKKLREIIIFSAAEDEVLEARVAALAVLWQWSFEPQLQGLMWKDRATKLYLLVAAGRLKPGVAGNDRVMLYALYALGNLAHNKLIRAEMWDEPMLQPVLLQALNSANPQIQVTALFVVQYLARDPTNQARMAVDPWLSLLIGFASNTNTDEISQQLRKFALSIIVLLSQCPANAGIFATVQATVTAACQATEVDPEVVTYATAIFNFLTKNQANALTVFNGGTGGPVLTCLVDRSELPAAADSLGLNLVDSIPTSFKAFTDSVVNDQYVEAAGRLNALEALANLALVTDIQEQIWAECTGANRNGEGVCQNLLAAAVATECGLIAFRNVGLEGLANLATNAALTAPIWRDTEVQQAFISAGQLRNGFRLSACEKELWHKGTVLQEVRMNAFRGFATFAADAALRQEIWNNEEARDALLNGITIVVQVPADNKAKAFANQALAELAEDPTLQVGIWENAAIRTALIDAASSTDLTDRKARAYAILALQELAMAPDNQGSMWNGLKASTDDDGMADMDVPVPVRRLRPTRVAFPEEGRHSDMPRPAVVDLMRREALPAIKRDINGWVAAGALLGMAS